MFIVADEETQLRIDIAKAKYLIHFREYFPLELIGTGLMDEGLADEVEKVVDKCIADNKPYPIPEDYYERMY